MIIPVLHACAVFACEPIGYIDTSMKLLQLGPYPPPEGGVERNLADIRRYVMERGVSNAVINLTRYRKAPEEGIFYPNTSLETAALLLRLPHRIIHLHLGGEVTRRMLALSLFICSLPGRKTVLTFHSGGYPSSAKGKAARRGTIEGLAFRKFDRIIAVNQEIADVMRRYGVRAGRLRCISPATLDPSDIAPELPPELTTFYATHRPLILTVSGLELEYDLHRQIDLLGPIQEQLPGAGLVILGKGSMEEEVRNYIRSKAWAAHILLAGDVAHGVTLKAMVEADMCVRTTLYDGDAISVRESLQIGTPTIVTDTGARPQGVKLFPIGDSEALKALILKEAATPRSVRIVKAFGRENLEAVFDLYQELDGQVS
jgi:glycosyltransferase involved in cell wall biosynthesis